MSNLTVAIYIYKAQAEFAKHGGSRYILQVIQRGRPNASKWKGVESLVELHYQLMNFMPALRWSAVELSLEEVGGYQTESEMTALDYERLFQVFVPIQNF